MGSENKMFKIKVRLNPAKKIEDINSLLEEIRKVEKQVENKFQKLQELNQELDKKKEDVKKYAEVAKNLDKLIGEASEVGNKIEYFDKALQDIENYRKGVDELKENLILSRKEWEEKIQDVFHKIQQAKQAVDEIFTTLREALNVTAQKAEIVYDETTKRIGDSLLEVKDFYSKILETYKKFEGEAKKFEESQEHIKIISQEISNCKEQLHNIQEKMDNELIKLSEGKVEIPSIEVKKIIKEVEKETKVQEKEREEEGEKQKTLISKIRDGILIGMTATAIFLGSNFVVKNYRKILDYSKEYASKVVRATKTSTQKLGSSVRAELDKVGKFIEKLREEKNPKFESYHKMFKELYENSNFEDREAAKGVLDVLEKSKNDVKKMKEIVSTIENYEKIWKKTGWDGVWRYWNVRALLLQLRKDEIEIIEKTEKTEEVKETKVEAKSTKKQPPTQTYKSKKEITKVEKKVKPQTFEDYYKMFSEMSKDPSFEDKEAVQVVLEAFENSKDNLEKKEKIMNVIEDCKNVWNATGWDGKWMPVNVRVLAYQLALEKIMKK